jgi:hypothetical protein
MVSKSRGKKEISRRVLKRWDRELGHGCSSLHSSVLCRVAGRYIAVSRFQGILPNVWQINCENVYNVNCRIRQDKGQRRKSARLVHTVSIMKSIPAVKTIYIWLLNFSPLSCYIWWKWQVRSDKINLQILWSKAFLEKLIIAQLVKKFPPLIEPEVSQKRSNAKILAEHLI